MYTTIIFQIQYSDLTNKLGIITVNQVNLDIFSFYCKENNQKKSSIYIEKWLKQIYQFINADTNSDVCKYKIKIISVGKLNTIQVDPDINYDIEIDEKNKTVYLKDYWELKSNKFELLEKEVKDYLPTNYDLDYELDDLTDNLDNQEIDNKINNSNNLIQLYNHLTNIYKHMYEDLFKYFRIKMLTQCSKLYKYQNYNKFDKNYNIIIQEVTKKLLNNFGYEFSIDFLTYSDNIKGQLEISYRESSYDDYSTFTYGRSENNRINQNFLNGLVDYLHKNYI